MGLVTLMFATPLFRSGLATVAPEAEEPEDDRTIAADIGEAVVVGAGPVGQRVASTLEMRGVDVCVVDMSPVNLHSFAQVGFRTVAGDASRAAILAAAGAERAGLAVICVPDDGAAEAIVRQIRAVNRSCRLIVRCRYQRNAEELRKIGADEVVSEEVRISQSLVELLPE